MTGLLLKLWRLLRGKPQWYLLWFLHSKFIVGVTGVIFNEQGQILLLRHRFWMVGIWGLPGGYANSGERLEETLKREVREETGYQVEAQSLIRVISGYRLRLEVCFQGRFLGGDLCLDPREVLEARFFDPCDLPPGLLRSHHLLISQVINA